MNEMIDIKCPECKKAKFRIIDMCATQVMRSGDAAPTPVRNARLRCPHCGHEESRVLSGH